jgi:hypothetical protein
MHRGLLNPLCKLAEAAAAIATTEDQAACAVACFQLQSAAQAAGSCIANSTAHRNTNQHSFGANN